MAATIDPPDPPDPPDPAAPHPSTPPDDVGQAASASPVPFAARPEPPAAQVRASDAERNAVVAELSEHAGAGRLTLAELEERVEQVYTAKTRAELAELTKDLPAATESSRSRRKVTRWFVAIMGGSTSRRQRRLSGRANVIAVMGGDDIDLREAEIDGGELVVNVFALLGGTDIYLPDSVEVELTGLALLGGNDERGSTRRARPGAPLIRIRCFALMGGVDVWRLPSETRGLSLKHARRAAKAIEGGGGYQLPGGGHHLH